MEMIMAIAEKSLADKIKFLEKAGAGWEDILCGTTTVGEYEKAKEIILKDPIINKILREHIKDYKKMTVAQIAGKLRELKLNNRPARRIQKPVIRSRAK
jgi:hypothetical protein